METHGWNRGIRSDLGDAGRWKRGTEVRRGDEPRGGLGNRGNDTRAGEWNSKSRGVFFGENEIVRIVFFGENEIVRIGGIIGIPEIGGHGRVERSDGRNGGNGLNGSGLWFGGK